MPRDERARPLRHFLSLTHARARTHALSLPPSLPPSLSSHVRASARAYFRSLSVACTRRVTLDAGSKGLAAEAGSPVALVLDHVVGENALEALTPSEEHLPCQWAGGEPSDAQARCSKFTVASAHSSSHIISHRVFAGCVFTAGGPRVAVSAAHLPDCEYVRRGGAG